MPPEPPKHASPCAMASVVASAVTIAWPGAGAERTALDDFVAAPTPDYTYRVVTSQRRPGVTVHVLHLASQTWRTGRDVDRILWRHWLAVAVPDQVEHSTAFLRISGADNSHTPPDADTFAFAALARDTRSVAAQVWNVPNQPLYFMADPELRERREDGILAFAMARHLESEDPTWIANLPMTRSVVRAMDAVTDLCARQQPKPVDVASFVVSGYSKRGWTSWLTAAVDPRVAAVAPIVIDCLNIQPSFKHQYRAYGHYAEAVADYVENDVLKPVEAESLDDVLDIVDPYAYRDRLTMPKLVLNSTGDQFFLPDAWQFYWEELTGPKYLRYVPNTDHSLGGSDAEQTVATFYQAVLNMRKAGDSDAPPLPRFTWKRTGPGSLRVQALDRPARVRLWQATNPSARDFRLQTIGKAWRNTTLQSSDDGVYAADIPEPAKGWTAFLIELTWGESDSGRAPITLSTGVCVTPTELPHELPQAR